MRLENDRLKEQLFSYNANTIANLKEKEDTIDRMQLEKESINKKLRDHASNIQNLNEENAHLKQQLSSFENLADEIKDKESNLEEKQKIIYENERLRQKVNVLMNEVENLGIKCKRSNCDKIVLNDELKKAKNEISKLFCTKENLKDIRLENDSLRQKVLVSENLNEKIKGYEIDMKEKERTINQLQLEKESIKKDQKDQIETLQSKLQQTLSENEKMSQEVSEFKEKMDSIEKKSSEPKAKVSSKDMYEIAMKKFETGSWNGAGSGIIKEGALDTAKYRIQQLEKEVATRETIEKQLRHERDTYFVNGGKWKTSFKQLEYKIVKRGCSNCKTFVPSDTKNTS